MTSLVPYYARLARQSGYSIAKGVALPFVRPEAARSGAHEMAFPISTYAPWRSDADFTRIHRAVGANTLVDIWRCHELWALVHGLAILELRGKLGKPRRAVRLWEDATSNLIAGFRSAPPASHRSIR